MDERISLVDPTDLEPERYELQGAPPLFEPMDRRAFFRLLGGGLVVLSLFRDTSAQESGGSRQRGRGAPVPRQLGAWLHVADDGTVTAFTGKAEVGQNARTSLTQAVADELNLPLESVRLVMADTAKVPFDMGTFGSRTTPTMVPQLRRAAAAARALLLSLAAEQLKVEPASLALADGKIAHTPTGRSLGFGELAHGRELLETIDDDTPIQPASEWKRAGQSAPKVDGRAIVTGRHRYTSDTVRPDMLRGKVLRAPAYGATLAAVDLDAARAIPGVTAVRDGDFVGVAAPDLATATRALAALQPRWNPAPSQPGDADLDAHFRQHAEPGRDNAPDARPAIRQALDAAGAKVETTYSVAYIAHAPLEPRAAVAEWEDDRLTVWTGTQRPFGVRSELAQAFRLEESQVRVIVPDTGSGYGGKHTGEAALEAARLARAAGRPVKLVWTREEEFAWAYFRPAGVIDVAAAGRPDGSLAAWAFHNYNSGAAGIEPPYTIPTRDVRFHSTQSPLRQGSYRALASTANHFARESAIDELAHALKLDPLQFRLQNLDNPRLRAVLEAAAERFGWPRKDLPPHHGAGLAGGTEKGGFVATCAEVAVDPETKQVRVLRLVTAFECGAVINPDHLRNQVEGCLVQGLGGALFESIQFADGKLKNGRFSRYRLPRFTDLPALEVILLDRKDLPSAGAGEAPIVALAPAIASAIHAAAGVRLRSLPLTPNGRLA